MREAWSYYGHLRRWWIIILLGVGLGALAGLGYIEQLNDQFRASATFAFSDSTASFSVNSAVRPTEREAVESLMTLADLLEAETHRKFKIRDTEMERRKKLAWWKPIVLVGVMGALVSIGGIYVWQDVQVYHRLHQSGRTETWVHPVIHELELKANNADPRP